MVSTSTASGTSSGGRPACRTSPGRSRGTARGRLRSGSRNMSGQNVGTDPLSRESSERQWRDCGKRESRNHIFVECKAWAPQIRRLWQRVASTAGGSIPKRQRCGS